MTWQHVLIANGNRGHISNARIIRTLPVNPNGSAIPNAYSAISNVHRHHAPSGYHNRRAVIERPRRADPP